jgi:hypothetical protein
VSLEPGKNVSVVARCNRSTSCTKTAASAGEAVVLVSELSNVRKKTRELQHMLGKKTMGAEILKDAAVEIARSRK